jgi:hypothetical protein
MDNAQRLARVSHINGYVLKGAIVKKRFANRFRINRKSLAMKRHFTA